VHIRGRSKLELRGQVRAQAGAWVREAEEQFVVAGCDDQQTGGPRYPELPPNLAAQGLQSTASIDAWRTVVLRHPVIVPRQFRLLCLIILRSLQALRFGLHFSSKSE